MDEEESAPGLKGRSEGGRMRVIQLWSAFVSRVGLPIRRAPLPALHISQNFLLRRLCLQVWWSPPRIAAWTTHHSDLDELAIFTIHRLLESFVILTCRPAERKRHWTTLLS